MEVNNRKGPGIFYAVVGVATLVVAIIGATFAFFSASADNTTAITGGTAEAAGITLSVESVTKTGDDMIPLNLKKEDTAGKDTVDQFVPAMSGACRDSNGNHVCEVYRITITNNSTTSTIDVRGDLTLTGAANMKWQLLNVTSEGTDPNNTGFAASAFDYAKMDAPNALTTAQLVVDGNATTGTGNAARKTLGTTTQNNTATYYVLIWLEEMGKDQGTDADTDFSGVVNFNAVAADGSTSGITASFTQG